MSRGCQVHKTRRRNILKSVCWLRRCRQNASRVRSRRRSFVSSFPGHEAPVEGDRERRRSDVVGRKRTHVRATTPHEKKYTRNTLPHQPTTYTIDEERDDFRTDAALGWISSLSLFHYLTFSLLPWSCCCHSANLFLSSVGCGVSTQFRLHHGSIRRVGKTITKPLNKQIWNFFKISMIKYDKAIRPNKSNTNSFSPLFLPFINNSRHIVWFVFHASITSRFSHQCSNRRDNLRGLAFQKSVGVFFVFLCRGTTLRNNVIGSVDAAGSAYVFCSLIVCSVNFELPSLHKQLNILLLRTCILLFTVFFTIFPSLDLYFISENYSLVLSAFTLSVHPDGVTRDLFAHVRKCIVTDSASENSRSELKTVTPRGRID